MTTIVGRKAMFNPILNGAIYYSNGIEMTPCRKNVQVEDGTIMGVITEDRSKDVLIAGPMELNGWYPVYLMAKTDISLLETDLQFLSQDQINGNQDG
jgi:hypothetical protein